MGQVCPQESALICPSSQYKLPVGIVGRHSHFSYLLSVLPLLGLYKIKTHGIPSTSCLFTSLVHLPCISMLFCALVLYILCYPLYHISRFAFLPLMVVWVISSLGLLQTNLIKHSCTLLFLCFHGCNHFAVYHIPRSEMASL